ncbi:hypothetical protein T08_12120 [Trichinella sp. T8]|nr:hypothetical protein T08_12120 [Trichinella sp. T8]
MNDKTSNKRNVTDPVGVTPPASIVPNGRGRGKNNTRAPLLLARFSSIYLLQSSTSSDPIGQLRCIKLVDTFIQCLSEISTAID